MAAPRTAVESLPRARPLLGAKAWIVTASALTAGGWLLSLAGSLTPTGYGLLFAVLFGVGAAWICWSETPGRTGWRPRVRFRRFREPAAMLFLLLLLAEMAGGFLYPPTNYDGLTYRVPRVLHWLQAHQWHWIGGWNTRMDYSAVGYEWLMAPILALFHGERLLFLPNLLSAALLPGLVFCAFRELGVAARVARWWMWILPCSYSLVLQAGSIGNDSFATVFMLASLVLARRACRLQSASEASMALLAMGLLTGAKASNLPLLLPCLIAWAPVIPLLLRSKKRLLGTLLIALVSVAISFIPMAAINWHKTGDWTGDPANEGKMKLASPLVGLAGNTVQLIWHNLQPSILPGVAPLNQVVEHVRQKTWAQKFLSEYPRFSLRTNELASEESAGMGIGLTLLLAAFYIHWAASRKPKHNAIILSPAKRQGLAVGAAGWVAFVVFMAKLGSEAVPRIATPYYPLLFLLPALQPGAVPVLKHKAYRTFALIAVASVFPAVIFSPARPLFPIHWVEQNMETHFPKAHLKQRITTVYRVYAQRSDIHAQVREQLPKSARVIGFAGTGDDSELSFWRPLGRTVVRDLPPGNQRLPDVTGVDVIVTYEEACRDRYSRSITELETALSWQAQGPIPIRSKASGHMENWVILHPPPL